MNILDSLDKQKERINFKKESAEEKAEGFKKFGIGINSIGLPLYEKACKQQLIHYIKDIEVQIGTYKHNLTELDNDHQILNQTYLNELNKADINIQTVNVIKRVMNKLVDQSTGLLCQNCMNIKEIKTL